MSEVSPEYHTGSPAATTAVARWFKSTTWFERLSITSWPLIASMRHFLLPLRRATLTRSQPIRRRASFTIVNAATDGSRLVCAARREIFELVPQRLPIAELTQLARAEEVSHQLAHLHQEFQIAALRANVAAGALKDLDQALWLALDLHGAEHEQQRRGISGLVIGVVAGTGEGSGQRASPLRNTLCSNRPCRAVSSSFSPRRVSRKLT